MHKSILVLEESLMVHKLFDSALPEKPWNWKVDHEAFPDNYIQKAKDTNPDIIFLSNLDQKKDYATVKKLRSLAAFSDTPILLLTSAKDKLDEKLLKNIGVKGFVRKPFESSTLHEQIDIVIRQQEHEKNRPKKDDLKDLNVVDPELMDLLSGKVIPPDMSIHELEEELDPTLQLIPNETENQFADSEPEVEEDWVEPEFPGPMDMIDDEDTEFADHVNLNEEDELDLEETDIEDIEVELEEIEEESDFVDLEIEEELETTDFAKDIEPYQPSFDEPDRMGQTYQTIDVIQAGKATDAPVLKNIPEDEDELGFMELDIVPYRIAPIKSNVIESISEDFDEEEFVREHSPAELENDSILGEDTAISSEVETSDDMMEIPHEEIIEDFYDSDEGMEEEIDDSELLDISVEGLDDDLLESDVEEVLPEDIAIQDTDNMELPDDILKEETDDFSIVEQETPKEEAQDSTFIEQEGSVNLEIDFDESSVSLPDMETDTDDVAEFGVTDEDDIPQAEESQLSSEHELKKRESNEIDIDLEELAAAGTEEASATIQEMIGFRQVMKARYEIPEESESVESDPKTIAEEIELPLEEDVSDSEDAELLFNEDLEEDSDEDIDLLSNGEEAGETIFEDGTPQSLDLLNDVDEKTPEIDLLSEEEEEEEEEEPIDDMDLFSDGESEEEEDLTSDIEIEPFQEDEEQINGMDLLSDEDLTANDIEINPIQDGDKKSDTEDNDLPILESQIDEMEAFDEKSEEMELLSDDLEEDSLEDINLLSDDDIEQEPKEETLFEEIELLTDDEAETEQQNMELLSSDEDASIEEIDFTPLEEDESKSTFDDDISKDDDIDNIDFLPLDEDEINAESSTDLREEEDNDGSSLEDIDFLPLDEDEIQEEESDMADDISIIEPIESEEKEAAATASFHIPDDQEISAIDEADEVTIEVPEDTFQMGDFNLNDITDDELDGEEEKTDPVEKTDTGYNLMEGIETVKAKEEDTLDEESQPQDSMEDMNLPSMDEDLPDLHPILDLDNDTAANDIDITDSKLETDTNGIQLVQNDNDFEDFPDEFSIIDESERLAIDADNTDSSLEEEMESEADTIPSEEQPKPAKKSPVSLSPELRNKLSAMIEGVISETVQNALHDTLPEIMDKIINEELDE